MHPRSWIFAGVAAVAVVMGCRGGFRINRYPTNESLYQAGLQQYQQRRWGNAIAAFEKLTNDLPPRDTLLPRSYWYLGHAHERQDEHLLAAQAFTRLFESFVDDTLADDAALAAARSYRELWRKPSLDATYGETALATYNTLIGLFGEESPLAATAKSEIAELEQWFATKNYETGLFYFRRKAYDSGILYFRDVVTRWPHVPRARDALLRLAESFDAIRYREDFAETCARLRADYPGDPEVGDICGAAPATPTTSAPTSPDSSTAPRSGS